MSAILSEAILEEVRSVARAEAERLLEQARELPRYLSVKRASEVTSYPEDTIRKWLRQGRIKNYGTGRSVRVKLSEIIKME